MSGGWFIWTEGGQCGQVFQWKLSDAQWHTWAQRRHVKGEVTWKLISARCGQRYARCEEMLLPLGRLKTERRPGVVESDWSTSNEMILNFLAPPPHLSIPLARSSQSNSLRLNKHRFQFNEEIPIWIFAIIRVDILEFLCRFVWLYWRCCG